MKLLYDFFDQARRGGLASLEAVIEEPSKSKTLATQPAIAKDHHISAFICDTFRTTMIGGMEPFDVDQMLETDIEVLHHEGVEQAGA